MPYILFLSFGLVLIAEIAGDKLLYTTGLLATRYRVTPILVGVAVAFMLKMAAAVLFGTALAGLHPRALAAISAVTFITTAFVFSRRSARAEQQERGVPSSRALIVSFGAVFFSEWGDIGQITAATLSAQYHAPLLVWLGATLAMICKTALAMTLGEGLRRLVPLDVLRYCGVSLLLFMGILSIWQVTQ